MVLDLSVIIPFKDKAAMTITCLQSLQKYSEPIKEIFLISNRSSKDQLELVQQAASQYKNTRVIGYDHPFNFQKINNFGAELSKGKVVFLLNNDIELTHNSKGLVKAMYQEALRKDVGGVGCVLLYEDRKSIQHAGVYLVPGGTADHLYSGKLFTEVKRSLQKKQLSYNILNNMRVTAVTAAAVMVERSKFERIGGMNEDFIICGGDVDLCLRLGESGYGSVLVGANSGYIIHKESKSRSMISVPYVDFVESYKTYIKHFDYETGDPFLHSQKVKQDA